MMRHKMIRLSLLCLMGLLCMVNKGWGQTEVKDVDGLKKALKQGGSYYLTKNINIWSDSYNTYTDSPFESSSQTTIDLNGCKISAGEYKLTSTNYSTVIIKVTGGSLNVKDTKGGGCIEGKYSNVSKRNVIEITSGSLTVENEVSIVGENILNSVVYVNGGSFVMTGGTISTSSTGNNAAVGVLIQKGSFVMTGGTISVSNKTSWPSLYSNVTGVSILGGSVTLKKGLINSSVEHSSATANPVTSTYEMPKGYGIYQSNTYKGQKFTNIIGNVVLKPINYTITYQGLESSVPSNFKTTYTIEDQIDLTQYVPTKSGNSFYAWFKEGVKITEIKNSAENITLTAEWNYNVTFHSNGGSEIEAKTYNIDSGFSLYENGKYKDEYKVIRPYYDFVGWYDNESCTGSPVKEIAVGQTGNKNLYAKWDKHVYSIAYDADGGTYESSNTSLFPTTYTVGTTDIVLGSATMQDADFVNWKDKNTNQPLTGNKLPVASPRDLDLVAVWDKEYTISFNTGTSQTVASITTNVSKEVDLKGKDSGLEKTGYSFGGWSDGSKTWGKEDVIPAGTYQSAVTLTAVWDIVTYTVTFTNGEEVETKTYTIESGLSNFPTKEKDGWIFKGWLDENNNSITEIAKGQTGDRALNANWTEIQYQLTYKYADGQTNDKTVSYTLAQQASTSLESASRTGYNFLGWFLPDATVKLETVPVDLETKSTPISFVATAKWEETKYPVHFKLNDGTNASISEKSYTYTITTGITDMPTASREGYTFVGWYGNAEGTGEAWTSVPAGTGELTLYAKWTPNEYKITYNWQGGKEVASAPLTFIYNVGATLPTSDQMEKANYTFAGWTREESSTNYKTEVPANTYAEDLTFYAQWTPKAYTVKFVTEGTAVTELPYVYGTTVSLKKTYRNGYTFAGWYSDKALTKEVGLELSPEKVPSGIGEDNTFTLYAKWTANTYTIEYDTYYGTIVSGKVSSYTTGEEVTLPTNVVRDGFSFAGWYADDLLTTKVEKIEAGEWGDKTFYASWTQGNQVIFSQPANGKITVTMNGKEISSGTLVGAGVSLTVTAVPTVANYTLKSLKIGDKSYTSSPQTVEMPASGGLVISATFADGRQAASAPIIYTYPSDTENVPWGEDVKVTLEKTDSETTLYYRLDDSPEKAYTGPFYVEAAQDTVVIYAIARKEGYADGISEQMITFDDQKVTLTFDLPNGVTAKNPYGEDLLTVIKTGGTFYFELEIDKNYYDTSRLDSMVVMANGKPIYCSYSGIYWLEDCTEDVTITISGLKAYTCVVTLQQTDNGTVSFTWNEGETSLVVPYGDRVSVTATPDEFYKFAQWNTGSRQNPMVLTIDRDTTLSAKFVEHYDSYWVVLPELEGATVKPFSGYTTEVKHNKEFKFYVSIASGYHEENLVVKANGEVLEKNKGGYAIYNITNHVSISVEGIVRDTMAVSLPEHVDAYVVETMEEAKKAAVYEETWLLLRAVAPEGKVFVKWTDGKLDNPRVVTALDAKQLIPLFEDKKEDCSAEVVVEQSVGAAITGLNMDLSTVNLKDTVEVKVIVLPAYSQSEVVLMANDKAVEAQTALRSTSEMKTYLYQFPVEEKKVTIRLEGLQRNRYKVSLGTVEGGTIEGVPTDSVAHGDTIRLVPTPLSGHLFMKWWNGQTLNPYAYVVTGDCTVEGEFIVATSPVANETVQKEGATIKVVGSTLYINTTFDTTFYVWDYRGVLLHTRRIAAGTSSQQLATGVYVVKVGEGEPKKIFVR